MAIAARPQDVRALGPLAALLTEALKRVDPRTRKLVWKRVRAGRWQLGQIDGRPEWHFLVDYSGGWLPVAVVPIEIVYALRRDGLVLDGAG